MNIKTIHQIELTSICNLSCPYCVQHGVMTRSKQHMDREVWDAAMRWVRWCINEGTQSELNLAGIGESTLHPHFADRLLEARDVLGPERDIVLASNGIPWTPEMIKRVAPARPKVFVSLHAPAPAARNIQLLREAGILAGVTADPAMNPNDWAGQVNWIRPAYRMPCNWIREGWGFVAADGSFLTCCLDASGLSKLVSVFAPPHRIPVERWSLCAGCYQDP